MALVQFVCMCVCVCVRFVRNMVFVICNRNYYHLFFFVQFKIKHPTPKSHRNPFFTVVVDVVVVASAVSGSFLSSGGSGFWTLGEQQRTTTTGNGFQSFKKDTMENWTVHLWSLNRSCRRIVTGSWIMIKWNIELIMFCRYRNWQMCLKHVKIHPVHIHIQKRYMYNVYIYNIRFWE